MATGQLYALILAGIVAGPGILPAVQAVPGRVGCFYDLKLCEKNELCFNDNLFGTCVSDLSDAVNYKDLEPEALEKAAKILQYLIETGYKWEHSYTQCVVGKFLQSAVSGEPFDADICEYLKALLDVIDQSQTTPAQEPQLQQTNQDDAKSPAARGEFLSAADLSTDFASSVEQPAVSQQLEVRQNPQQSAESVDPNAYEFLRQYLEQYQQALQQAEQNRETRIVEKKSGPADFEATTAAPAEVTTPASQTGGVAQPLQNDSQSSDGVEAILSLFNSNQQQQQPQALQMSEFSEPAIMVMGTPVFENVNQMPDMPFFPQGFQQPQQQQPYPMPFGNPPVSPDLLQQIVVAQMIADAIQQRQQEEAQEQQLRMMLMLQQQAQQPEPWNNRLLFNDRSGLQFTPDMPMTLPPDQFFRRTNRAMDFGPNPAEQLAMQRQMFAPQQPQFMMQMQPDMMPFMPPQQQMIPEQMMMVNQPPIDPRIYDILMAQQIQQLQMNQLAANPMMMMQQQMQQQQEIDPRLMFAMDPMLANRLQGFDGPAVFPEQFMAPPNKRGGFAPQNGPLPYQMGYPEYMPYPYGMFPGDPIMQQNWAPPMMLPPGFQFADPRYDQINANPNDTTDLFDQSDSDVSSELVASSPFRANKKDQEYGSLLRTNDNSDGSVDEDVRVKIVTRQPGDNEATTQLPNSDDTKDNSVNDKYVFLITNPSLTFDEARILLNWLSSMMSLPLEAFYDLNIDDSLMTFRVNPNLEMLNATYVAQTLGDAELRKGLRGSNQLEIVRAGVGRYAVVEGDKPELPQLQFQQLAVVQSDEEDLAEQKPSEPEQKIATRAYDPAVIYMISDPAINYDIARRIMNWLALTLDVPQTVFTGLRIEGNQLQFRVSPYFNRINATQVASWLSRPEFRASLMEQFGVDVIRAGVGEPQVQAVVAAEQSQRQSLLVALVVLACASAVLVAVGIILLIRKNLRMRRKLAGLTGKDVESSKEYEELCRQRMAQKNGAAAAISTISYPEKKNGDKSPHSSTSSWNEEPAQTNMDITTGHMILSYMEDHLKHENRLDEEWSSLSAYEPDPAKTDVALKEENVAKNRYPDILPYDHTRVVLDADANGEKSDYINADYITDSDPKHPVYIATQGPLPESVNDFWQMVWERNSAVIVNLTKLKENDMDLCHPYWPKEGTETYGHFEVNLISEHLSGDDYLVRSFYLKNLKTHETRTVTQFHYLTWPHLAVPSSLKTFLEFRRKINKCYKGGSAPIIVHCSTGADRTGAYCLIDLVLNRMAKGVKEIDIAATLEHLRDQRMNMVQTKEQFEFVLSAVAQEVQAILKSMPQ